jgi:flagellar FliL protein
MAKEADLDLDTDSGKPVSGSRSRLIIIIVAVLLLLCVSAAATLLLTGMIGADDEAPADAASGSAQTPASEMKVKSPLNYIPLDPPFVVNFSGTAEVRFLQVSVEVGTRDATIVERIKEQRPAIRNALVFLLSNQDPQTLISREGKEALRNQALAEIQRVIEEETGDAGVESVFFTSFVMQ